MCFCVPARAYAFLFVCELHVCVSCKFARFLCRWGSPGGRHPPIHVSFTVCATRVGMRSSHWHPMHFESDVGSEGGSKILHSSSEKCQVDFAEGITWLRIHQMDEEGKRGREGGNRKHLPQSGQKTDAVFSYMSIRESCSSCFDDGLPLSFPGNTVGCHVKKTG
jgi:hypothetical protein